MIVSTPGTGIIHQPTHHQPWQRNSSGMMV
jgi:hypothetical protein